MDVMDNETITIEPSLTEQSSGVEDEAITIEPSRTQQSSGMDNDDQYERYILAKTMNKMKTSPMQPTPLEYSCWRTHWSAIPVYAFGVFTLIVIVVGVLIVCLTVKKPDATCKLTFKRSAQHVIGYDSHPRQIAVGAFNKDKYLDLVVANSGSDCVGIFMGYGNGTFATQMTYSTGLGSSPYSVVVGDFNNDTKLDIVVANYGTHSIGVLLGYGNGSFRNPVITSLGSSRPLSIVVGDFDNDKVLDIAVVNYGTLTVAILSGANDGSFRIDATYDMGYDSIPYAIAVGDMNKDGRLDLAIVNYGTSELVIVLRTENGSFTMQKYTTGDGSHPTSVVITDLHNDHILDIVVASSDTSNVNIFQGYEDGHFTNVTTYSSGSPSRPQSLVISDFNNDTRLDIAVTDSINNNVLVLKGNTNGSFSLITAQSTGYNSDPCSIIVGDFDNDDRPDIAIANNGTNNILVLTSFAIYPTTTQVIYPTGENSRSLFADVADFNEDSYLDVVVANSERNNIGVFINLGNRIFTDQQTYDMSEDTMPAFVTTGDLNNDNHSDIVVVLRSTNEICILLGYGNGTFRNGNIYSTGDDSDSYTVSLGDLDNDGNLDLVISLYGSGNVGIFFGYGDGTFTSMTSLLPPRRISPKCAGVGDFNNDNILDIAASDYVAGGIIILLGYGNGSFQNPFFISTEVVHINAFTIGDVNGDNWLDVVYSDYLFSHVGVLFGYGNGTFGSPTKYLAVDSSETMYRSLGYYNDDDLVDIVVASTYDASIRIYMGIGNGLFGSPNRLSTGYWSIPYSASFADFDNDNQQDILVSNDGTNNILIFFVHNYDADFVNQATYTTGSALHPYSVSVGDLDNDGQSDDVVVANAGNDNIEILLHFDRGIFSNRTVISTLPGSHPQGETIVDFNRDHLADIAVINSWDNTMNVFLGSSDGSFDTGSIYFTGSASAPNAITAGDLNGDGRIDVVIANEGTNNVAVFLAHDYVIFTNEIVHMSGILPYPLHIATGDFNNDDLLDFAVVDFNYGYHIYLGYGNGTFSEQISQSTYPYSEPRSLAVGDFNDDNYLDIVVGSLNDDDIGVFLGYGNGSFQSPIIYSTGESSTPYAVAIGDFNIDNNLDIVVVTRNSDSVWIFWGLGNGSFSGQIVYSMPFESQPVSVVVGDLNNDNFLDIVVANFLDNVCILPGYNNGSFGNSITLYTGSYSGPWSVAIGDLNKDHSLDIVVANQGMTNIGIFFGYGNGTFSSQKIISMDSHSFLYSVVISDINNDTILDILLTDLNKLNSSIGIFYGYGDGNFTLPKIYVTGSITQSTAIATGDFDNDGRIDLAVTHCFQGTISIMLQRKMDLFASPELFYTGDDSRPKSIALGDFNNDDLLDTVVANSGTDNIGIRLGYGGGYFSDQFIYSTGSNSLPSSLAVGDFNNDHYLDIVVVNSAANNLGILFGYGNGTFVNMLIYSTGISSYPSCVAVDDLNRDNYLDLVVANWGINNVLVFFGKGNGTLSEPQTYPLDYAARPQSVAIGDINNDNLLDIVVANDGAGYVEILLQIC